ncbi:SpoIVB peptidase S55 domain-containing protein [Lysinibacillus piscis]|uniref:SpoIVB peptidase n=1 Tax=Lysinibacillus piscis TaxID=2518931 RepID=A0ABQ5NKX1_9BACI|nr:SpoIVB peptidase S55 domain-containing protein [Lysinibacillus sp. KH24]GLC88773.1 SpoIVB peptidase [Lysinibacillus sp. KH24]
MNRRWYQCVFCAKAKRQRQFVILPMLIMLLWMPAQAFAAKKLIPMGEAIGIQLQLSHVFVAHDVLLASNEWMKGGAVVEKINDTAVKTLAEAKQAIAQKGQQTWTINSEGKEMTVKLQAQEAEHVISFLKDETDGVGTLTYIDPETKKYGALGHQIVDATLQQAPTFLRGSIFLASIQQIRKSTPGQPGYKISSIEKQQSPLGTIDKNTVYGIFGRWEDGYQQRLPQAIEIMHEKDIKIGKAEIYTAIEGKKVERFAIDIIKASNERLEFVISDEKLIEKTGGILQGMSGSPIIQDGRFVGAVTHMFVEEPKKGAAISVAEMLRKSS